MIFRIGLWLSAYLSAMGKALILRRLDKYVCRSKSEASAPRLTGLCSFPKTGSLKSSSEPQRYSTFNSLYLVEENENLALQDDQDECMNCRASKDEKLLLQEDDQEEEERVNCKVSKDENFVLQDDDDQEEEWVNCKSSSKDVAQDLVKGLLSSQRFFFCLVRSNSILEKFPSEEEKEDYYYFEEDEEEEDSRETFLGTVQMQREKSECVAVIKYSPNPYIDFSISMQELVFSHGGDCDWEFLRQMVLCFLELNPNSMHAFILGAFADLLCRILCQPASSMNFNVKGDHDNEEF